MSGLFEFGTDWLYLVIPLALNLALAAYLIRRAPAGTPRGLITRFGAGAAAVTGLPAWCVATLTILIAGLNTALQGFLWDVAWHIDIGRDEFLFSPPHVALIVGLGLIAVAGAVGIGLASASGEEVGWHVRGRRVPFGALGLLVCGSAAMVGFGVDELWHAAYGLDASMWSPPHLTMISSASFATLFGVVVLAEAGPAAGAPWVRRGVPVLLAGTVLLGLSAWQLEFDLGVPQWQQLFHPVLIALAAGFALTAARAVIGRGGALAAVAVFLVLRLAMLGLTAGVWHLTQPRFPLYIAAALGVEVAFTLTRERSTVVQAVAAGAAVGTIGLGAEWAWTHIWGWHPWGSALLPAIAVASIGAVGAALLGTAFGRVTGHRPSAIRPLHVAAGIAAVAVALAVPFPRNVARGDVVVTTDVVRPGWVDVAVEVTPPDAVAGADRFEVSAWQGQGRVVARLLPVGGGRFEAERPVPVGADWKTVVLFARRDVLGAVPVFMPEDREIDASEVPVVARREQPFAPTSEVFLREAHGGPAWPGIVGYSFVATSILTMAVIAIAGAAALERRRRARGWVRERPSLAGQAVLLSGAAGGIGQAARAALEAQGARVIGLDLVADRPDTLGVDVTDAVALRAAVDEAARRLDGLDVIIANAGIGTAGDSTQPPDAVARRLVEVNLFGSWEFVAAALPHLRRGGRVIVVASGLAYANIPYAAAYSASKRAVNGYACVLRLEAEGRFAVTVLHPAYIRTAIHDGPAADGASLDGLARRETVDDAAAAIVTACETDRRELGSSPLTTLDVWFARVAPALTDRVIRHRWRVAERSRPRPRFVEEREPARR